jgi:hypothetical protein
VRDTLLHPVLAQSDAYGVLGTVTRKGCVTEDVPVNAPSGR